MLELAILGLLKEQPMHGYQLSRELGDSLGGFWRVSYGSLYPTLRRLERDGRGRDRCRARAPDPGVARRSTASPSRARAPSSSCCRRRPHDNSTEDTRFRVRLAFFRYLPPETRIRLLERRRAYLEDRLVHHQGLAAHHARAGRRLHAAADRTRADLDRESDIAWVDDLIAAERTRSTKTNGTERGATERRTSTLRRKEHTS